MEDSPKAQVQTVEIRTTESKKKTDHQKDNLTRFTDQQPKTLDEKAANVLKKLNLLKSNSNNIDDAYLVPLLVELLDVFGEKGVLPESYQRLHTQITTELPENCPRNQKTDFRDRCLNEQNQHGGQSVSRPPNQRKGDWTCPNQKCSNINFAKRDRCNKCGLQKPLEFRRQDEERMRNAPVFKPGDWYCPRCSNLNFAKRKNCTRCNLPIPLR